MNLIPERWYLMLLMPSFLCLMLVAMGLILIARYARRGCSLTGVRLPWVLAYCGVTSLYIASTPLVATWLSSSLERMTPSLDPEGAPEADAIVVLGGGQSGHAGPNGFISLQGGRGTDRLEKGIRAFQAGKAPVLVVGGGIFGLPSRAPVSHYMRDEAVKRGVPTDAVLMCGEARYTSDEGSAVARLLRPIGARRILLCTSATHLPRARITYEKLGFEVIGIPCDFDTRGEAEHFTPLMLLPRGQALQQTENGLKEWLGFIAARLFPSS